MCNFDSQIFILGAKSRFFCFETAFLSTRHITTTPESTTFPLDQDPNLFSLFLGTGRFPGLIPKFGHFWGVAQQKGKYPQFWSETNETRVILQFPKNIDGVQSFFGFRQELTEKRSFHWKKWAKISLKSPKIIFLWEKKTFFHFLLQSFAEIAFLYFFTLCSPMLVTWLGPNILARKRYFGFETFLIF